MKIIIINLQGTPVQRAIFFALLKKGHRPSKNPVGTVSGNVVEGEYTEYCIVIKSELTQLPGFIRLHKSNETLICFL